MTYEARLAHAALGETEVASGPGGLPFLIGEGLADVR